MASTTIASFIDKIGFKVDEQSVKDVNSTAKSLKSSLTKILGTIGIAFSLTQMNAIIESYNTINKKIASAVDGLADAEETQDAILDAANECRVAYSDMAESVSDLVSANSDLFDVDSAVAYAKAITQIGKASGASDSEISSLLSSMKSSFANGKVSSSTISSLVQTMPEAAEILAESLGTTTQKLTTLASQGRISCKELRDAFLNASDEISEAFEDTNMTISEAITVVKNKWSDFLVEFNDTYEITNRISKVILRLSDGIMSALNAISARISWLSEKLGGVENLVTLVTAAVGALVVAFKWDSIIKGVSNFSKIFSTTTLKIMAVAAVLLVLYYLVEDFVGFMQGKKSVIGDFFEKMGIDCDKVRDGINSLVSGVSKFFSIMASNPQAKAFFTGLALAIGVLATAYGLVTIATTAWHAVATVATAVTTALSVATSALSAPVLVVAAAIAALIVIVVLLVKNWDKVKEGASNAWSGIKNAFGNVKEWFKDKFGGIWDNFGGSEILSKIKNVWESITSVFKTAIQNITQIFKAIFSGDWASAVDGVKNLFSGLFSGIKNIFSNIVDAVKTAFNNIIEGLKNVPILGTIIEAFQSAIDWIKALPENALQWGKDIIQGIIDGIKEKFSGITDAVSGVAEKIKGFLGFSEPEEGPLSDFRTYMPDMMDSLASGIEEGRSKVKEALEMVTGDMSAVVQAGTVSASTAGAATASSTSKTIIQYNSFNNEFNGDVAGQQKSATAMSSATDDTVSALSRAMAIG